MTQSQAPVSLKLLLPLLASIMAVSPFAIDLYLPAMPEIAQYLSTEMPAVQNSLSIYLVGYAVGLLMFGPLADKYPRRYLVLFGLIGFCIFTLALLLAQNIEQFITIRFLQAMVSSAATVVVFGTIREYYGKNTAKGLSYVSMIMMLAPMIAPSIGSFFLFIHSWQAIFVALTVYALIVLILVAFYLPNANAKGKLEQQGDQGSVVSESAKPPTFLKRYKIVLSHTGARMDLISSMMVSLAFFAYITAVPFIYMTVFGVNEYWFSILFALTVMALMIAHFTNSRMVVRKGSRQMQRYGLTVAVISSVGLVTVNLMSLPLAFTITFVLPLMGSISMIAVNTDAMVLQEFAEQSGTATAVIGVLRFGIGGLAGPILAIFYDGTAIPFSLLMASSIMVVLVCQLIRYNTQERVLNKEL
ncbi:MAG: multidrug effflux MFS transporter [Thalassotalea sp.]|nr:multidrug effflux MFS transporter [Thalassotalea sp.]